MKFFFDRHSNGTSSKYSSSFSFICFQVVGFLKTYEHAKKVQVFFQLLLQILTFCYMFMNTTHQKETFCVR